MLRNRLETEDVHVDQGAELFRLAVGKKRYRLSRETPRAIRRVDDHVDEIPVETLPSDAGRHSGDDGLEFRMACRDDQSRFGALGAANDGKTLGVDIGLRFQPVERAVEGLKRHEFKPRRLARRAVVGHVKDGVAALLQRDRHTADTGAKAAFGAAEQQDASVISVALRRVVVCE